LVAMSLLQVRFLVVAATFGALAFARMRPSRRVVAVALLAIVIPLALAWLASGSPLQAHRLGEMAPFTPWKYVRGFFGILLDAQTGMLLQAPLWLAGVLALAFRWRSLPDAVRWGVLAAVPYLVLLLPRDEWHGGWSPPLRYLVVFAPLIAAGASRALERGGGWIAPVAVWTALLAVHGAAFPWRLFHLATGTSVAGEWLSSLHESDFSRLLPSFIRPNAAAWIASLALICAVAAALVFPRLREARLSTRAVSLGIASLLTAGFAWGLRPGSIVHFEDAHVRHIGGEIHPAMWTVARFRFAGGWAIGPGDAVGFRIAPGPATLWVSTSGWGRIRVDGEELVVSPTRANVLPMKVTIRSADAKIDGIEGIVILDRIERE
ncbi:MAG TPA: hypothetical protein VMS56_08415, partial [Thermoanaerobaculia bacterium]|nr:hypothetical protein [Thermoanaerobaculia bacterium]